MRRLGIRSVAAGIALVLVIAPGCASWLGSVSQEERSAFARAESADERGENSREGFLDFLERFPDSVLAADARLALGDLDRKAGDLSGAARRYTQVVAERGEAGDRARVRLAVLALERGDERAARRWLGPVRLSRLEGADLRNAYRALAESAQRPAMRLRWMAALRAEVETADLASLDFEIDRELASLSLEDLAAATSMVGDRPPGGRVYLVLAERALEEGRLEEARSALADARTRALAPRYASRLADLERRLGGEFSEPERGPELPSLRELLARKLPDTSAAEGTLGVLLPLSGPYAPYGERALQGVLLAAGVFDAAGSGPQVRVVVRDTAGDPARAIAGVRELVDEDAVAIIGPMISSVCEAAAAEAEDWGIPLLALTARESVPRDRPWVFRVLTRPREEAELLAERSIALGDRNFAILYPEHKAGLGFRSLFWDAVEERGGRIVGVASYDPEATDFGESIRSLVGYSLLNSEERELLRKRERMLNEAKRLPAEEARELRAEARALVGSDGEPIPPIVDFDTLFIPDSHHNIVLIAPQLAFHEATGARLLGTSAWYDESLLRLGGRHLEGALLISSFYANSELPHVAEFSDHFDRAFGVRPEGFSAQSFDAAQLVLVLLARGERDRRDVRQGLLSTEAFAGVSGVFSMKEDGNAHKRPFLLEIERGRLHELLD